MFNSKKKSFLHIKLNNKTNVIFIQGVNIHTSYVQFYLEFCCFNAGLKARWQAVFLKHFGFPFHKKSKNVNVKLHSSPHTHMSRLVQSYALLYMVDPPYTHE